MKNRIIKFRVWHTVSKQWLPYPSGFGINLNGEMVSATSDKQLSPVAKEFILMQYTGLKDKSGKEIYEADILKTATDKPMVVSWNKKFASFCLDRDGWAFSHWFGESCNPEDCEVIGNIYENQDLIEVK